MRHILLRLQSVCAASLFFPLHYRRDDVLLDHAKLCIGIESKQIPHSEGCILQTLSEGIQRFELHLFDALVVVPQLEVDHGADVCSDLGAQNVGVERV